MPETLTESFCERCGTRYTFEAAAPRIRLQGIKVLSRGLKNFVMSDGTTMDEAMAAARSETDREATSQQLDAFHKTFNFCMSCRQYTCGNCWNEAEGQCLSCAPHLGQEIMPAPFPDLDPAAGVAVSGNGANGTGAHATQEPAAPELAWPTMDLERDLEAADEVAAEEPSDLESIDAAARLAALGAIAAETDDATSPTPLTSPESVPAELEDASLAGPAAAFAIDSPEIEDGASVGAAEPDAVAEASPSTAGVVPHEGATATDGDAVDVPDRAAAAAAQTSDLLRRFRPGQSLDDELEAYERAREAAAEPARADEVLPTAPEVAAPGPVATPDTPSEPPAPIRDDVVAQPTWQIVAPDPGPITPAPDAPGTPAAPPVAASAEPQWPAQPAWPERPAGGGLPAFGRPAQPTGGLDALWAESAREVVSAPLPGLGAGAAAAAGAAARSGVQPCVSCGLSLSATARFCRRCGTRQG